MIVKVKITPNAARNAIEGMQGDLLRVRIAAPPDKGKANEALIAFLAKEWKIPKSHIRILSGHASRIKRLEIDGMDSFTGDLRSRRTRGA